MIKIYSKIDKNFLLHTVSLNIEEGNEREDITDNKMPIQLSRIKLKNSKKIKPHSHLLRKMNYDSINQNECWIIINGNIEVSLFDIDKTHLKTMNLHKGNILFTSGGGHSIDNSSEDSEFIEVKLGPYTGKDIIYFK
jgi:hypothetical protein